MKPLACEDDVRRVFACETDASTIIVPEKYIPYSSVNNSSVREQKCFKDAVRPKRCQARLIMCCGLSVRPEMILVAIVVLFAGVTGLVFTVCSLHVKVGKLEELVVQKVQNDVAGLKRKSEITESPYAWETETLYEKTVQLLNRRYDAGWAKSPILPEVITGEKLDNQTHTEENDVIKNGTFLKRTRRDVEKSLQKISGSIIRKQNKTLGKSETAKGFTDKGVGHLESSHFEVDFYNDWYNHKTNFSIHECITDDRWPTRPVACRGRTIKYSQIDSPLAFFRSRTITDQSAGHKKKKRKNNRPLMEITNQKEGIFGVRESGIYLIHLNIMIVDESHTHSLGISLNNQTVLTCYKGGFRCPQTNVEGSYKYRICVIDGVLEMTAKDQLQIKTMEKDTVVKLVNERKSQFKALLLHTVSP
ncbi:hypothetical protein Btru_039187 [Bulinus truncatus]|nr:hypothetical protein Btru_039187 [Bulinus truncatus]